MSTENSNSIEGGLKTKKVNKAPKFSIQNEINKDLYEKIPIELFKQEVINTKFKNTFGIKCRKCGSENVYSESRQTRSGDEAMTVFYTCLDCDYRWRVG